MKVSALSLFVICFLASITAFADSAATSIKNKTIHLGTWSGPPMSFPKGHGLLDQLMYEAFNKCCNLEVKVNTLPPERSLKLANSGIIDGELPRIAKISGPNSNYPNLLQVNTPISPIDHVAFTKNPAIHITRWDELELYNVGIVTGWKILERNIHKYRTLTKFDDEVSLFNALNKGRIDAAVYDRLSGLMEVNKMGLNGIYGGTATRFKTGKHKLYLYMHKKHKNLIPKLEKSLKEMLDNNSYERIYCESLYSYMPKNEADEIIMNALKSIGAKRSKRCK